MILRKKSWRKSRNVLPTFIGTVTQHGNSANVDPTLPKEYIGKRVLITILDDDTELVERLNGE